MLLQNVLRLWPTLLVGNAMTVQQSLCLAQPASPPYLQSESAASDSRLLQIYTGFQEELATMLRQVLSVFRQLVIACHALICV